MDLGAELADEELRFDAQELRQDVARYALDDQRPNYGCKKDPEHVKVVLRHHIIQQVFRAAG